MLDMAREPSINSALFLMDRISPKTAKRNGTIFLMFRVGFSRIYQLTLKIHAQFLGCLTTPEPLKNYKMK